MTVIAWDGKTLAADKRAIQGGGISRSVTKIQRHGKFLLAVTGGWDVAIEMREWWKEGADPAKFPSACREDTGTLIVINAEGIDTYASCPYPLRIESKKCAFGSGRDYAEDSMYLGKSAVESVQVACVFQSDCGNGIDSLDLWGDV